MRGRRLRYELRRLREARGLTIEQVSGRTGGDLRPSTISRWETGDRRVPPTELRVLLDVYEIGGDQRDLLLTLARQARERGWWQSYSSTTVPAWFQTYVGLEAEAALIRDYSAELIPGLLQTPDYYRAFIQATPAVATPDDIDAKITVRRTRQERLSGDDPPRLWVVLNEAVIRRIVGGPTTMRAQLHHVATAARQPHVTVQILPFRAGAHPAMDGSFITLGFPEPADPDVVYLEGQTGSLYLDEPPQVERYSLMFDHLVAQALDPDESHRLIAHLADELSREARNGSSSSG